MTLDELQQMLVAMPEPAPVFYRLYHDNHGVPLFYSMEDQPGTYIDIDPATFAANRFDVRVRDGRLLTVCWRTTAKLVPGSTGTSCHPKDVSVVVSDDQPHVRWSKRIYEAN